MLARPLLPTHMPLERWCADAGSPLYVEVMNKVPVVAPKDMAFVDKAVRETSLKRMVASPAVLAASADDEAAGLRSQATLHRESARAVLARRTEPGSSGWGALSAWETAAVGADP